MADAETSRSSALNQWGPSITLAVAAAVLGCVIALDPRVAIALCVGVVVGYLIITRNLLILIPMTTVSLVMGSSTLPGSSVWFVAKFVMIGAVAATILPALAFHRSHLPVPSGFVIGFGGLVLLMFVSTSWSETPSVTMAKAISMLLLWLAVSVAIPLGLRDSIDLERTIFWIGVVAAATVIAGLALAASGVVPWLDTAGRFRGILVNANTLGYYVAPIFPALIILASQSEARRHRLVLVSAISVIAFGLALTGSRGGALAAVAGVTVALVASLLTGQRRQARRSIVMVTLGLLAAVALFSSLHIRNLSPGEEGFLELGTGSLRTVVWADGLRLISERPVLGHGFATTQTLIPGVQDVQQQGNILGNVHDSYLEAAIDLGWVGTMWLGALGLSGIVAAWRVARSPGLLRWSGAVLLAGIVGGMVNGVFESGLLAAGGLLAFPFWLMVTMAHSIRLLQREEASGNQGVFGTSLTRT